MVYHFNCPCCDSYVQGSLKVLHEHFNTCMQERKEREEKLDMYNQEHITLNAAIKKFNKRMEELGYKEIASVNYTGYMLH